MLVKGLVLATLIASTPLAIVATQDPRPADSARSSTANEAAARAADLQRLEAQNKKAAVDLAAARRELAAARADLERLGQQLDQALDALERTFEQERDRNCSPSRSRSLMSHYQWLRSNGLDQRATTTLAKAVDQIGDSPSRLNSVAWDLMTNAETTGKFDEVALAIAERMQKGDRELGHNQLGTMALAHFLNGQIDQAVALQQRAIERGGKSDEFQSRLRTYQAAQVALAKAAADAKLPVATMMASNND